MAYAQHVYRQQGASVERAVVLTGGWQTSRESAYVQASRARDGTDWYLSRQELGEHRHGEQYIQQLAAKMRTSRAHTPTITYREVEDTTWELGPERPPARTRHDLHDLECGLDLGCHFGLGRTIRRDDNVDRTPGWSR